ncbi:MAG: hypothetical protein J6U42_05295 [Lachnospiraceae bacterium]|nr:hypothetical protein [Lachnospiraceae bacterium]
MKKITALFIVVAMVCCLAACGKVSDPGNSGSSSSSGNGGTSQQSGNASGGGTSSQTGNSSQSGNTSQSSNTAEPAKLNGKIDIIDLDDRDASVLRGVRIIGNCAGNYDNINGKASSLTDVRCIFELNEWIDFYPDTDAEYYLRVWVLKHRDDKEYYNTCKFSDLMPGFVSFCDLHYPVDSDTPDDWPWGSFYLNPEDCEPGYYDFVFTYEGKAIGVLMTRFYKDAELGEKSGAELEALMHE